LGVTTVLNNVWAMAPWTQNLPRWASMAPPEPMYQALVQALMPWSGAVALVEASKTWAAAGIPVTLFRPTSLPLNAWFFPPTTASQTATVFDRPSMHSRIDVEY
jgi:hypothetical protein